MKDKKIFLAMSEKDIEFLDKNFKIDEFVIWVLGPSAIDYLDRNNIQYKILSDINEHHSLNHKVDYGDYALWLDKYDQQFKVHFKETLIEEIEFFTNSINMLRIVSFYYKQIVWNLESISLHENCYHFYFFSYLNNPLNVLYENNTSSKIFLNDLGKLEIQDVYLNEISKRIISNWVLPKRNWRQRISFLKRKLFRLFIDSFKRDSLDVLILSEEATSVQIANELSSSGFRVNFFDQIFCNKINDTETSLLNHKISSLKNYIENSEDDDFLISSGFNFNKITKAKLCLFLETYVFEMYKTIKSYNHFKIKPKKIISSLEIPHWDAIIDFDKNVKFDLLLHGGTLGIMKELPLINYGYKKNNYNIRFISYSEEISSFCDLEKLDMPTYKAKNTFANFSLTKQCPGNTKTPKRPLKILYVQSVFARSVYQKEGAYQDAALYKLRKNIVSSFLKHNTTDSLTIKYGYNTESINLEFDKKIIQGEIDRVNHIPSSVNLMDVFQNYDVFYIEIPSSSFTELVALNKPVVLFCDSKIGGVTPFLRDNFLNEINYIEDSKAWSNIFKDGIKFTTLAQSTREKVVGGRINDPSLKERILENL